MEHDFTEFPIRIAIILRFGLVNAITIEFLCKSNSFFSFYKRKLKKRINFPVPLIHDILAPVHDTDNNLKFPSIGTAKGECRNPTFPLFKDEKMTFT